MKLQELESIFQSLVDNDSQLTAIRKKISEGKATFKDTADYNERISTLLGRTLAKNYKEVPKEERKDVCEKLLYGRYIDINEKLAEVQTSLDKAKGIHIAPQKPAFPSERVNQVAASLEDKTVSEDVIQRRANGPVANVSKSFHDDYMKQNAEFRSKAGLKCYINRDAAPGCCKWCSELAGRYEYGQEPEDVYHRHDNCSCTTIYEDERKRQEVWSKLKWEVPDPEAGAPAPTVFDDDTRPTGFQPKVLRGLKSNGGGGIMKLTEDEIKTIKAYISSESYMINAKLRAGLELSDSEKTFVTSLDRALSKVPTYEGTVYRSIELDMLDDPKAFWNNHKAGNIVKYQAYTSSSLEVYDENMKIQCVIESKTGRNISNFNENEKEILFERGKKFLITKADGKMIFMQEV